MTDLRAECLAMADWLDMLAFSIPKLFQTAALLRRVADALPQEPKGDVFEVVARAISDASFFSTDTERAARAALSAAEPFIQARIREAVEAVEAETARCVRAAREEWADDAPPAIRQQPEEDGE